MPWAVQLVEHFVEPVYHHHQRWLLLQQTHRKSNLHQLQLAGMLRKTHIPVVVLDHTHMMEVVHILTQLVGHTQTDYHSCQERQEIAGSDHKLVALQLMVVLHSLNCKLLLAGYCNRLEKLEQLHTLLDQYYLEVVAVDQLYHTQSVLTEPMLVERFEMHLPLGLD